tara:strand:+ start:552 stop:1463 length:912 start_codon:yes stop_codon:yes gene_type:complete
VALDNSSSFNYFFFNLVVSLPFEVDFLNPVNERADISFTFDENIKFPKNCPKKEIWSLSNINKAFFYNRNIGLFEITNGKNVRLSLKKEISKEEIIKNFIFTPMALILFQRRNLVIHASASVVNSQANLFIGMSGYGKSTILLELIKNGHKMLSEDVSAISFANGGKLQPSFPLIKIDRTISNTEEICASINNIKEDERNRKIYKVQDELYFKSPVKVSSCFLINPIKGEPEIKEIKDEKKIFFQMYKNIWRQVPVTSCFESQKQVMQNITNLIKEVKFFELSLSLNISDSANYIQNHIKKNP